MRVKEVFRQSVEAPVLSEIYKVAATLQKPLASKVMLPMLPLVIGNFRLAEDSTFASAESLILSLGGLLLSRLIW